MVQARNTRISDHGQFSRAGKLKLMPWRAGRMRSAGEPGKQRKPPWSYEIADGFLEVRTGVFSVLVHGKRIALSS